MKQKTSFSKPAIGMDRDSNLNNVKSNFYTLGVNINSQSESGDSYTITNEPSNYLSVQFYETYKVIGFKNNLITNRTYFYLTSTESNINSIHFKRSIVGYVDNNFLETYNQDEECLGCKNPKNIIGAALETIVQSPSQTFVELVHDRCISLADIETKGLNFDINFPIKKIEIKQEKLGTTLYWNDNRNYFRYLQVGRIEEALANNTFDYLHSEDIACDDPQETPCLNVEKLLISPKHTRIRLEAEKEQIGGNLKQGTYEFWAAYCDSYGNEITEYTTPTNPISIWDENNYIQAQTETDDFTNFAIKVRVHNLDSRRFKYYKIAVIERNNVSNTESVFLAGIYPTADDVVVYTHSGSVSPNTTRGNVSIKTRMDMADLYAIKPQYKRMKGTMVSEDRLFGFGLEEEEEINLQPVVNLFSGLVKAQTSVANENLYKSSIATSKYKQYPRNEVQPLAIRLLYNDGGYSANFPFVGRPKTADDEKLVILTSGLLQEDKKYVILKLEVGDNFSNVGYVSEGTPFIATGTTPTTWTNNTVVTDVNTASLIASETACNENTRQEKWQIFNTATLLDSEDCFDLDANSISLPAEEVEKTCYVDIATEIPTDTIIITDFENFTSLEDYINNNPDLVIPEITPYLEDTYLETCIPLYVGDCDTPVLRTSTLDDPNPINQIEEVIREVREYVYKTDGEYLKSLAPQVCSPFKRNTTDTGALIEDEDIDDTLLICSGSTRQKAYLRDSSFSNEICAYATSLPLQTDPTQSTYSAFFNYDASDTLAGLLLDNATFATTVTATGFYTNLHNKAQFFSVKREGRDKIVFEISKKSACISESDVFANLNNTEVRYVIYDDCTTPTELGGGIVDLNTGELVTLDVTGFPNDFIIAVDTKITTQNVPTDCTDLMTLRSVYYVTPPCGCFGIYQRNVEAKSITVTWDSIKLRKKIDYVANCTFTIPKVNDCDPIPYKKYKMAYWESTIDYPDNKQLYDSSVLKIRPADLSILELDDKADFINYYTDGINVNGVYNLKSTTDLRCQPIRHPKLPDNTIAPFMLDNLSHKEGADSIIFPMGINLDSKIVQTMIEVAYFNGLITKGQKEKIVGWEILKGDNSIHKSITASGILYDVYKYTKKGEEIHFSNFPFNDLGNNKFVKDPTTKQLIKHPFNGSSNNKFTFLSPDMFLTKPAIPTEMSLQGYMFGNAETSFAEVKDHPKWTILGKDAYTLADILAVAELLLEKFIKYTELQVEANKGYWFVAGVGSTGTGSLGAGLSTGLNIALGASLLAQGFVDYGRYRNEWIQIFKNLGRADNFASFQFGVGKHNRFLKLENEDDNCVRKLAVKKHLRDGRYTFTDENDGSTTKFNHYLRENSVFLSTGDYSITYPEDYKNFDNNILNTKTSSNFLSSEVTTLNPRRNIANPYIYLKNYVPDQWDTLDSIKWLTTNYIFDLQEDTACKVIYGGSQVISRYSWRVKVPFFTDTAIKLADKLPYLYSKNSNIGDTTYFCNYDTSEDTTFKYLGVVFPEARSEYNFDEETGKNSFYVRPPSKFYLYTHGVVDFLVESEINCNFRYGKKDPKDQFYKNQNLQEWLQEVNLPIVEPNTFYYNNTYSFPTSNTIYKKLDRTYDKEIWRKRALKPNAWIWSEKDMDENSLIDPYLVFKPLNFLEEGTDNGKLIDLRSIESNQFLGRYENTYQLFNPANAVADAINNQNKELGTGFLAARPTSFKKADLGFAGTQHTDFVSTPYGHFWVDAKRGRVFQVDQNGGNMEVISEAIQGQPSGMKQWFREHLPFKILKQFPNIDVDNKYKGLGMNIWYDARFDRVFFTKRDYIAINTECLKYEEGLGFYEDCDESTLSCPNGYTYNVLTGMCELTFDGLDLCPTGYTYDSELGTCTLIETLDAVCECTADVVANNITICNGTNPTISLTTTSSEVVSFTWTVIQSGVTGATAGSGNIINQTLTNSGVVSGTATYIVTPTEVVSGCIGTPYDIIVTVAPTPNVIATPSSLTINTGSSANIDLSGGVVGTTFTWTVVQSGVTGASAGSGSTINQILTGEGIVAYTITPSFNGCLGAPINVAVTVEAVLGCGASITASGDAGYYEVDAVVGENTGIVTVTLNAANIPDRFQIIWDGNIVSDSLFIGDALPDAGYENSIIAVTSLNKFLYDGVVFNPNGVISVDYSAPHIANSTGGGGTLRSSGSVGGQIGVVANYPSPTAKASEGNVKLAFNKTTALPANITIVVIGVEDNTGWFLENVECPV